LAREKGGIVVLGGGTASLDLDARVGCTHELVTDFTPVAEAIPLSTLSAPDNTFSAVVAVFEVSFPA